MAVHPSKGGWDWWSQICCFWSYTDKNWCIFYTGVIHSEQNLTRMNYCTIHNRKYIQTQNPGILTGSIIPQTRFNVSQQHISDRRTKVWLHFLSPNPKYPLVFASDVFWLLYQAHGHRWGIKKESAGKARTSLDVLVCHFAPQSHELVVVFQLDISLQV